MWLLISSNGRSVRVAPGRGARLGDGRGRVLDHHLAAGVLAPGAAAVETLGAARRAERVAAAAAPVAHVLDRFEAAVEAADRHRALGLDHRHLVPLRAAADLEEAGRRRVQQRRRAAAGGQQEGGIHQHRAVDLYVEKH